MASSLSTEGLARSSTRRPWFFVGGWIVALIVAGIITFAVGLEITTQVESLNDPESKQADDLLQESGLRGPRPAVETVIIRSETVTADDPAFREFVDAVAAALRGHPDLIVPQSVFTYYDGVAAGNPAAEGLVSEDRRTTIVPVTLAGSQDDGLSNASEYLEVVEGIAVPEGFAVSEDFEVLLTVGNASVYEETNEISEEDIARGEGIGIPTAFIVLVIVLGALLAAVLPIILGIAAIFASTAIAALVSQVYVLSFMVTTMITMIGLAVGIDYALFLIDRYREERKRGADRAAAIVATGGTASRAVFFSGMTVVLALLGLFLVPNNIFRSLSFGAVAVVVVAVLATLTFVPALLALLGDRINWPRHRKYDPASVAAQLAKERETYHSGFWGRMTRAVMARPVISVVVAVVVLVALALPFFDMESGLTGISSLPEGTESRDALEILTQEFSAGLVAPVEIVVDGPQGDPAVQGAIEQLYQTLANDPVFAPPLTPQPQWSAGGDVALISVPLTVAPDSDEAVNAVKRLRDHLEQAPFGEAPAELLVSGQSAISVDFLDMTSFFTPIVFVFVLGLSFLILLLAFRSIVVPVMAIVMNLLSVGAAYGLIVFVFQWGNGADLLGFQETPTIEAWIPLFLFCVLFGLSMDYHVFLLSRIREHYSATHNNAESVAAGLQATARLITGAALIMVVVFSGFAAGRLVPLQQLGFGLAVSVALDATIIRTILVPASMELIGDRNWYLPSWLKWIPDLRIEGKTPAPVPAPGLTAAPGDD